ncbi:MAG: hypothetical protein EOP47_07050 [Sphingobacteriaceae bacterium]|nr:MAG: hypothetical protein EOP47_07050 [Sphingobacteriaceae bacterium]
MALKENEIVNHLEDNSQFTNSNESETKPVREGEPMGGQKFGESGNTYAGDDKNNPSQNAGYTNEYFRRTEPSDENTEEINFKVIYQKGSPDYDKAQARMTPADQEQKNTDNPVSQSTIQKGIDNADGSENDNRHIL